MRRLPWLSLLCALTASGQAMQVSTPGVSTQPNMQPRFRADGAIGLRSEIRLRSSNPGFDTGTGGSADAELSPFLTGRFVWHNWSGGAFYMGTLRVREPYLDPRPEQVQRASVDLSWSKDALTPSFFASSFFNYGVVDLSNVQRTNTILAFEARNIGTVTEAFNESVVGTNIPTARLQLLSIVARYTYGGGIDARSKRQLPFQRSPWGTVSYQGQVGRNTFALSVDGRYTEFDFGNGFLTQLGYVNVRTNWVHRFSGPTRGELAVGGAYAWGKVETIGEMTNPLQSTPPYLMARVRHRFLMGSYRFDFRPSITFGPYVDRFRGTIYSRLEGEATLLWAWGREWTGQFRTGFARAFDGTGLWGLYGEGIIGYRLSPMASLEVTGRTLTSWTLGPDAIYRPDANWLVSVAITLQAASIGLQPQMRPIDEE